MSIETEETHGQADPSTAKSKPSNTDGKKNSGTQVALCASCDRCRARKTKCDGKRPCGNCAARYLKKHKLTSIEGIDLSKFECVYSPAKRRGPVPGKAGQARKASEALGGTQGRPSNNSGRSKDINIMNSMNSLSGLSMGRIENGNLLGLNGLSMNAAQGILGAAGESAITAEMLQQHLESQQHNSSGQISTFGSSTHNNVNGLGQLDVNETMTLQRQLMLQQQLAMQGLNYDKNQGLSNQGIGNNLLEQNFNAQGLMGGFSSQQGVTQQQLNLLQQLQSQQQHVDISEKLMNIHSSQRQKTNPTNDESERILLMKKSFTKYASLLRPDSLEGNRLRSFYDLSINECFNLPPIPNDEDYCSRLNGHMTPNMLPRFDLSALKAARFSEIALGAFVNNQTSLALKLSNTTVLCLRECIEEPVHQLCKLSLARAYFLHGLFRYFRGDMERYFKYRRVCMKYLSQMDQDPDVLKMLAAVAFNDTSAYMVYNAEEFGLPKINDSIPPLPSCNGDSTDKSYRSSAERKYETTCKPSEIVRDCNNQMWIQGAPQVFINNEAPLYSRALDALSFAIRHCCDQANTQFRETNNELGEHLTSPTSSAVSNSQNELCSRNMVLSAFTLLQRLESESTSNKFLGLHLFISGMDAFQEGGDEEEDGGFTDSQIQGLLHVCNTVIQRPHLLFMPGPTYHMVTNATILLCHLLNAMYTRINQDICPGELETALFEEVFDTFTAVQKLLKNHRSKLPKRLRCHGIPRPSIMSPYRSEAKKSEFINLGETSMCTSRSCQGFVLMSCSPCVAAERARASAMRRDEEIKKETESDSEKEFSEIDKELNQLGLEFDMDDDALLNVLSKIISA